MQAITCLGLILAIASASNIAQMEKQCDRDHEDLQGLNIALDSKQQKLELVSPAHFSPSAWFRD